MGRNCYRVYEKHLRSLSEMSFWIIPRLSFQREISMIVTCASCLTKFNLEDSRIPAKGAKVRCSRCKHVFYVVPPPETKEEVIENFESFAKYHEGLMEPGEKKEEPTPEVKAKKEEVAPEEEGGEAFLFSEKAFADRVEEPPSEKPEKPVPPEEEELPFEEPKKELKVGAEPSRPKSMLRAARSGPSRFFALLVVLVILVFAVFYLWTELGSGGKLSPYIESPAKKINELWNQIWGIEKEDLTVGDLSGYEEKMGEIPLFIIEGKVKNQSRFTKKYIKIRVVILDQDKLKVAEKEAICGRTIDRTELKQQPIDFFKGDMVIKPPNEEEMRVPPGKGAPFMVIFKDLPSQAKDFKYEILEAPNL